MQRQRQKLIEIAPAAASCADACGDGLLEAALALAAAANYRNLGTFEFLVDARSRRAFAFIEANARLQVEHTVTEEVTGSTWSQAQLEIAGGRDAGRSRADAGACRAARHRDAGARQPGDDAAGRHGARRPAACCRL